MLKLYSRLRFEVIPGILKGPLWSPFGLLRLLLSSHRSKGLKEAHRAGQGSLLFSMAYIAKSFYDLSAIGLDGEKLDFNTFRGRAVLIENVASLWGTTTRDYNQLNELQCRFPRRLVVLGFPCNQFGHQVRSSLGSIQGVDGQSLSGRKGWVCLGISGLEGHAASIEV